MEVITELSKISLPPWDKNLLCQPSSFIEILSKRQFQSPLFNLENLKGSPRYLIGRLMRGVIRMVAKASCSTSDKPKQTKPDLSLFNLSPESSPKISTKVMQSQRSIRGSFNKKDSIICILKNGSQTVPARE
jgi:hypothetical protein